MQNYRLEVLLIRAFWSHVCKLTTIVIVQLNCLLMICSNGLIDVLVCCSSTLASRHTNQNALLHISVTPVHNVNPRLFSAHSASIMSIKQYAALISAVHSVA